MDILKQLVCTFGLCVLSFSVIAQNKYALLIGINDYYEVRGIKSNESLKGSVNDAVAMRQLLTGKFGFKSANIDTIYNATATRDNIIESLKRKLKQCKAGDMMVFYYSGHGVWMENSQLKADLVKRGMNQAMLTSDLYSYKDHFKCFIRDTTLKTYFNYFVDKKVVLTAIFDCCFSGNLAMADNESALSSARSKSIDFNDLMARLTEDTENPQQLIDSISGIAATAPTGCSLDALGAIRDTLDSDMDGIPDCKDKEKFTSLECLPADADGVGKCAFDYLLQKTLNKFDTEELDKNKDVVTRNFNPTEVLSISEIDTIARPAERKNSRFLFLSATTDAQKALEFKDQNNEVHGLFTAAMLRVFSKNSVNIPVSELFEKIKLDMEGFHLDQNPTTYSDPVRLKNNLIGTQAKR